LLRRILMGGVFGCLGKKCYEISSTLEETLDESRGGVVHVAEAPDYVIGVQAHNSRESQSYVGSKVVVAFLSDSAKLDFASFESSYISNGFRSSVKLLPHVTNADFALVLFDLEKRKALLACDSIGIRKIFYTLRNGNLIYSSSLKHLVHFLKKHGALRNIDDSINVYSLRIYLTYGVTPLDLTLIKDIYKLQMGQIIFFDINNSNLSEVMASFPIQNFIEDTEENLIRKTYELLENSVKERLEDSNGVLLSGGIDSSLIASFITKLCPLCRNIAVNVYYGSYSELEKARRVSEFLGIKLIEAKISLEFSQIRRLLYDSILLFDEPIARGNFIGRYYALKELHKFTGTVFLGEGADELFLGYWPNYWSWYYHPAVILATFPLTRVLSRYVSRDHVSQKYARIIDLIEFSRSPDLALMAWFVRTTPSALKPIFACSSPYDFVDQKMLLGVKSVTDIVSKTSLFLFKLLMQADVAVDENISSRLGLKLKLPYLDSRVVKFAFSINPWHKLRGKVTKYLLRKVIEYYDLLPSDISKQEKSGFTSGLLLNEEFLTQELREFYYKIGDVSTLRKLIYHAGESRDLPLMISALVLCKWYESMKDEA
jgi:asparagine synthase (glutamine-hydrolysing)